MTFSLSTDGPNRSAPGGETRASRDGSPVTELRSRHQPAGQTGNNGPDVRFWEGAHTHRQAAAGEEPLWPHADWQGDAAKDQQPIFLQKNPQTLCLPKVRDVGCLIRGTSCLWS